MLSFYHQMGNWATDGRVRDAGLHRRRGGETGLRPARDLQGVRGHLHRSRVSSRLHGIDLGGYKLQIYKASSCILVLLPRFSLWFLQMPDRGVPKSEAIQRHGDAEQHGYSRNFDTRRHDHIWNRDNSSSSFDDDDNDSIIDGCAGTLRGQDLR